MEKGPDLILCKCGSDQHQMIIHHDVEENEVYIHVHLSKRPFFKRLISGIRYIFGYYCKYGHWEEMILDKTHAEEFQNITNTLKGL